MASDDYDGEQAMAVYPALTPQTPPQELACYETQGARRIMEVERLHRWISE